MLRLPSRSLYTVRLLLITFLCLIGIAGAADTRPNRVAIIPFDIHSDRDMSFLRDGITDMLTSRLSWEKKVQVLGREQTKAAMNTVKRPLNEIQAQIIGAKLEADYVLFGSLTIFADSVSMDAKLVDVSGAKPTMAFFKTAQGMGQVIPQINWFATDINSKVFGRSAPAPPVAFQPGSGAAPAQPYVAAPQAAPAAAQPDVYAHPEKMVEGGFQPEGASAAGAAASPFGTAAPAPPSAAPISGALVQTEAAARANPTFWKSRNFKDRLAGIAIGDLTGDGKMETVLMGAHELYVYQLVNGQFKQIAMIDRDGKRNLMGVDVGDINGNGYAEIYVSALNVQKNLPESRVFEFNGQSFVPIIEGDLRFFRIVTLPLRGKVLLGQEQPQIDGNFQQSVRELVWVDGKLASQGMILPENKANIIGLAWGDLRDSGSAEDIVAYDDLDYIQVMNAAGSAIWKSKEKWGGSRLFFSQPHTDSTEPEYHYYPMRILMTDFDQNGTNEVIAVFNRDAAERKAVIFRKFIDSYISGMSWEAGGLAVTWKTRIIPGQTADIAIGDIDNDGQAEIAITVMTSYGEFRGTSPSSAVIVYETK